MDNSCLRLVSSLPCMPVQEASYDYMEKEGERTFLECLDQLEVANARLEGVSTAAVLY